MVSLGIGFISGDLGLERFVAERLSVTVSGGIRQNYLPSNSPYADYKEYQNGWRPTSSGKFLDFGEAWSSLFLSSDVRFYFLQTKKKQKSLFDGIYFDVKYIFTGKGLETYNEKSTYAPPPTYTSPTYISHYRSTHRMGFLLGAQSVLGKKERFLLRAEAGLGTTINFDFSRATTTAFANFRFAYVLHRF